MPEYKTTTEKELQLTFEGSDGKTKRLVIAHPEDNLDEATTRAAVKKITDAHLFEDQGVNVYDKGQSVNYMTRKREEIWNDKKKDK